MAKTLYCNVWKQNNIWKQSKAVYKCLSQRMLTNLKRDHSSMDSLSTLFMLLNKCPLTSIYTHSTFSTYGENALYHKWPEFPFQKFEGWNCNFIFWGRILVWLPPTCLWLSAQFWTVNQTSLATSRVSQVLLEVSRAFQHVPAPCTAFPLLAQNPTSLCAAW